VSALDLHQPHAGRSERAGGRALLVVDELAYAVAGRSILDGVSFELRRGELVCVMGPSGAGKTTLLKCLNRLLELTGGRVLLDGVDTDALSPVTLRRRIGMVWQTPFMFAGTVAENLRRAVELSQSSTGEEELAGLLERVAFDGALGSDARVLSVGQQQRVSIARALACRPELLLCDEPTAALDHDNALRLEATFRELCAGGMSVVWVTHDRRQAERIADRTLLLADGALREPAAGAVGVRDASIEPGEDS
jgi:putative ABC transport system ATP-binding protein